MPTFNEFLQQAANRTDPVGQIGRFWSSLDNRPRVHAPTGVENHLRKLGDGYTQELRTAFAMAADEYRSQRQGPGVKLDGPENAIITLGAIHQALTAVNLGQQLLWTRMTAIGLKVGLDFADEPFPAVQPLPVPQPPNRTAGDPPEQAADGPRIDSEPFSGLDWAAAWTQADFSAPGDAQEAA